LFVGAHGQPCDGDMVHPVGLGDRSEPTPPREVRRPTTTTAHSVRCVGVASIGTNA